MDGRDPVAYTSGTGFGDLSADGFRGADVQ